MNTPRCRRRRAAGTGSIPHGTGTARPAAPPWAAHSSGAAHRTGKALQDAQHPVEGAEIDHTDLSVGNDRFIAGEQVHDGVLEDEQQDAGQDGVNAAHAQGDKGALF